MKTDAESQEVHDRKDHEGRATKLAEDIAVLKKRLAEFVAENKEKEQNLRKVSVSHPTFSRKLVRSLTWWVLLLAGS